MTVSALCAAMPILISDESFGSARSRLLKMLDQGVRAIGVCTVKELGVPGGLLGLAEKRTSISGAICRLMTEVCSRLRDSSEACSEAQA